MLQVTPNRGRYATPLLRLREPSRTAGPSTVLRCTRRRNAATRARPVRAQRRRSPRARGRAPVVARATVCVCVRARGRSVRSTHACARAGACASAIARARGRLWCANSTAQDVCGGRRGARRREGHTTPQSATRCHADATGATWCHKTCTRPRFFRLRQQAPCRPPVRPLPRPWSLGPLPSPCGTGQPLGFTGWAGWPRRSAGGYRQATVIRRRGRFRPRRTCKTAKLVFWTSGLSAEALAAQKTRWQFGLSGGPRGTVGSFACLSSKRPAVSNSGGALCSSPSSSWRT